MRRHGAFGRSKPEFPRRFMTLEHGIPSRDAFSDLFNALDRAASAPLSLGWRPSGASV